MNTKMLIAMASAGTAWTILDAGWLIMHIGGQWWVAALAVAVSQTAGVVMYWRGQL